MPTALTLAGVDFSTNPLIKALPAIAGLQAWAYFGTDLAHSQNMVAGSAAFTLYGSGPTFLANAIRCPNGNGIQTPVASFAAETHLIVAKTNPQTSGRGNASLVSNLGSGGSSLSLGPITAGPYTSAGFNQSSIGTPATQNVSAVPNSSVAHKFFAGTSGGATNPAVYNLSDNLSTLGTGSGTNSFFAGTKVIGSTTSAPTTPDTSVDVAWYAYYSAILTKPQIDSIYASVRQSLALRGITV